MWVFGNIIDLASSIFYPEGGSYAFSPPEIPNNKQWLIVTIYFIIIWVFSIWHSYRVSCKDIKSINTSPYQGKKGERGLIGPKGNKGDQGLQGNIGSST